MSAGRKRSPDRLLVSAIMLFFFSAFLLVALRGEIRVQGLVLAAVVPLLIYASTMWIPLLFPADKLLLAMVNFLCALGILVLFTTDQDAGTNRGITQAFSYGLGLIAMLSCSMLIRYVKKWDQLIIIALLLGALLIALPLVFGKERNGAKNWVSIGGKSFQPSEAVKIVFLLVFAYGLSFRKTWFWLGFGAYCMLVLLLQKDLGTALVYYLTGLLMLYAAGGTLLQMGIGVMGSVAAAVMGYKLFDHVKNRVAIWKNPWLYYEGSGYQIVQALIAIASGGFFGSGLGLGSPRVIPVYYTDCIFAVICEEFGIIFGILVLVIYILIILRGIFIALQAKSLFHGLICIGSVAMLGVQTFLIIGGVLKMIPLTGVTLPFVSYGGTSLVSCMAQVGLIQGAASLRQEELTSDTLKQGVYVPFGEDAQY